MTILQAAYHEVALTNSRLRTENDVMRACLAQREAEIAKLRARLAAYEGQLTAESGWQKVYDEFEDQFFAPADIIVLLAWEEVWPEPRWAFEVGVYRSTKGGWIHGRATHWQNLPAPPHAISTKREEG